ncbi:glycosyltransferase family 4 protein [Hydrogenimonas thermophila]|uniref:glycosyltransferase family 4 protein n=1 Tax=Hydrogenimonas thermophila TaxID=223786 RepID=UPI0029370BD7|nr:glycosyltransferase family 4 protein [Hydrogenimonas thermophila]WOE70344.1 glycosyltransferase family 4 protein [Hydrogenimonas thermophila]WOE72861.1 glycosyltransferase family 4 protein [Hydrogenimonas thermophila]
MKISVLHTEWSDGWGGQEIRIINEMLAVREKGVNVYLACRENSTIKKKALEQGITVFSLPFRGNADIITIIKLINIIKKYKIDIVNTHSGKDTWVGGLAAKIAGVKFIRTRHLSNPINSSRFNFINELADFIITTGESVRQNMIDNNRIKPDRIQSIPTGIDEKLFNPSNYNKDEVRKKIGIKSSIIVVGILAVLRGFKRHDIFLDVAEIVSKKYPEVLFLIAGDGPRYKEIESLINQKKLNKNVKMLGHIDKPAEFLSILDIFVLTSDSNEGVPQSVIQALMMEIPVISTDVGSTKDLWNKENFILVKPNSTEIIAEKIIQLMNNQTLIKKYKENSRKFVVSNFSKEVMVAKLMNIYNLVMENR